VENGHRAWCLHGIVSLPQVYCSGTQVCREWPKLASNGNV
jgi:hypothetical protein